MLVAEQEDEEEEDLKDLIKDMELEDDEAAKFRTALGAIVLAPSKEEVAKAKKAEEEKDIKTNRIWLALEAELELESELGLEQAKALLAEKDEAHAKEIAAKDEALAAQAAELEQLRAQVAEGVPPEPQ